MVHFSTILINKSSIIKAFNVFFWAFVKLQNWSFLFWYTSYTELKFHRHITDIHIFSINSVILVILLFAVKLLTSLQIEMFSWGSKYTCFMLNHIDFHVLLTFQECNFPANAMITWIWKESLGNISLLRLVYFYFNPSWM